MAEQSDVKTERPLSPHLFIYKLQMTMLLSGLHRISGAFLSLGLLVFVWWLVAASIGPEAYGVFTDCIGSPFGLLVMLGFTGAFYYHLANGIRHLIWDSGHLFEMKNAFAAGYLVLFLATAMSLATWYVIYTYGVINL